MTWYRLNVVKGRFGYDLRERHFSEIEADFWACVMLQCHGPGAFCLLLCLLHGWGWGPVAWTSLGSSLDVQSWILPQTFWPRICILTRSQSKKCWAVHLVPQPQCSGEPLGALSQEILSQRFRYSIPFWLPWPEVFRNICFKAAAPSTHSWGLCSQYPVPTLGDGLCCVCINNLKYIFKNILEQFQVYRTVTPAPATSLAC